MFEKFFEEYGSIDNKVEILSEHLVRIKNLLPNELVCLQTNLCKFLWCVIHTDPFNKFMLK